MFIKLINSKHKIHFNFKTVNNKKITLGSQI